ncbi:hypothetical protein MCAMS1_01744 [biofilm metagenome]
MKPVHKIVLIMSAAVMVRPALATPPDRVVIEDVRAFLNKYLTYNNSNNQDITYLYDKNAEIRLTLTKANNETIKQTLTSGKWVDTIRNAIGKGQTAQEIELRKVKVRDIGGNIEVSADRYSRTNCYTDNTYKMVLAKGSAKAYRIVYEELYISQKNQCPPPDQELSVDQKIQFTLP